MNKPKYNVGDKVVVLNGKDIPDYTGSFAREMNRFIGKVLTIEKCDWRDDKYGYYMKETDFVFDERGLAPYADDKVIIFRDKKNPMKVVAKNFATGETAKAVCSPDDTFDFMTGAKLALDRLHGADAKPTTSTEKQTFPFKVGDVIACKREAKNHYEYTCGDWVGQVTDIYKNHFRAKGLNKHRSEFGALSPEHFYVIITTSNYTGDLVCVRSKDLKRWTVGKVYHATNGVFFDNFNTYRHVHESESGYTAGTLFSADFVPLIKDDE